MQLIKTGEKMLRENKLRAKIVENNLNIEQLSKKIGIDKTTFYRKIARNTFTINEVDRIAKALNMSVQDVSDIFFAAQGA